MDRRSAATALRLAGRNLGRRAVPADDEKAGFVTGPIINVDGGFTAAGYLPVRA